MSTFNDIEMKDSNGDTFRIDLPFEFTSWNKAVVRNCHEGQAEFSWSDIVGSIRDMIEEKKRK